MYPKILERMKSDVALARFISAMVAYSFGLQLEELESATRCNKDAARARQIAMYLMHTGISRSLSKVAVAFGRDRTTVSYAMHKVEDMRSDPVFDKTLDGLLGAVGMVVTLTTKAGS